MKGIYKQMNELYFQTNDPKMNTAFRIALGDLYGNIRLFKSGMLETEKPVILAGMDYDTPWTRDAAINTWNGAGLIFPEGAKDTLLSVLTDEPEGVRIDGEYWDAIIWAAGAWQYYLFNGDREFLELSLQAVVRSLEWFEQREYVEKYQLFSGAACYGDGIAAYDDEFAKINGGNSGIASWWQLNAQKLEKGCQSRGGVGLPMFVLSTNCLYYQAYQIAGWMAEELKIQKDNSWSEKAEKLKASINQTFWDEENGNYAYYLSPLRKKNLCDSQEALGIAFACLFGIADENKKKRIFKNYKCTAAGIPCVWPSFSRYDTKDKMGFGRHSGTVWPHAQGFWADAAKQGGNSEVCWKEIDALTEHACRDQQFAEIYHPVTGEIYGGLQERRGPISLWHSCDRQTWSATAYLRMMLFDVCGMDFTAQGIRFSPDLGERLTNVELRGIYYRGCKISLYISGEGNEIQSFSVNGELKEEPFLLKDCCENAEIVICMKK